LLKIVFPPRAYLNDLAGFQMMPYSIPLAMREAKKVQATGLLRFRRFSPPRRAIHLNCALDSPSQTIMIIANAREVAQVASMA
jgi:hypothetical protein